MVSQSGSVALSLGEDRRGWGISYIITAGNEAVTGVGDYVAALAEDTRVRVISCSSRPSAIPGPRLSCELKKARAAGQTVLAVKVGSVRNGHGPLSTPIAARCPARIR